MRMFAAAKYRRMQPDSLSHLNAREQTAVAFVRSVAARPCVEAQ